MDDARAERVLNAVLDAGICFIDTSPDYGDSEQRIGRYLSGRRERFFIASKCGCLVGRPARRQGGIPEHEFTPENIRAGVEQSLQRLRIETLDLVQFHVSPARSVLEENGAVETLLELRGEGKLRFLGMSGVLPHLRDHIEMAFSTPSRSPIRRSSWSTKRPSPPRPARAPASSSAEASRAGLPHPTTTRSSPSPSFATPTSGGAAAGSAPTWTNSWTG